MKKFIVTLFISLFQLLYAQSDNIICDMPDDHGYTWGLREVRGQIQRGGLYETSTGTLKVLVVFARIKNDNSPNNDWPAGQDYPYSDTYIDESIYVQGTNLINLTNYFSQMSLGTFHVIGEVINVETLYERNHYANYYQATKEILQNQVDQQIDYSQYDNWTPVIPPGHHINAPDGIIDMIMVVWRGQPFLVNIGGIADLGGGSYYTVESGTKTIDPNFDLTGSGVTVQNVADKWPLYNFHSSVHEMGHYLIGGSHPYNPNVNEHGIWGILRHGHDGVCANAFERELLAWINPTPITGDILNAPFSDYISTGLAYKYKPVNGGTYEYYYFENHQKLSIYDDATVNGNEKGIFIVHQNYIYNSQTNSIRVKTSDGDWNWQNLTGTTSCFGSSVPIIKWKKQSVNRAGKNHRDQQYVNNNWDWIWWVDGFGCGGYPYDEILNEAFKLNYNDVFSPKSNPYSYTYNNIQENFTMELFSQNGSILNAKFYLTDPYAGKPSKPQNLVVQVSPNLHPYLTWDANQEPDMLSGGSYRIEKYSTYEVGWFQKDQTNNNYYEDISENYCIPPPGQQCIGSNHWIRYRVKAVDNTQKVSVPSDSVMTLVNGAPPDKISAGIPNSGKPNKYSLMQNYPNPFNPFTTISYSLPKNGFVTLKVFDILGKEIAELVNEVEEAGNYSVIFNASEFPSGIYFYTLTSGNFTATKKLILLK